MIKVAITNQKGGVGKTTSSINISYELVQQNKSVLVIDIDPQANTTSGLNIERNMCYGFRLSKLKFGRRYTLKSTLLIRSNNGTELAMAKPRRINLDRNLEISEDYFSSLPVLMRECS